MKLHRGFAAHFFLTSNLSKIVSARWCVCVCVYVLFGVSVCVSTSHSSSPVIIAEVTLRVSDSVQGEDAQIAH